MNFSKPRRENLLAENPKFPIDFGDANVKQWRNMGEKFTIALLGGGEFHGQNRHGKGVQPGRV